MGSTARSRACGTSWTTPPKVRASLRPSPVVYNWLSWTYDKKGIIAQSVEMDLKDEAANGASAEKLFKLRKAYENSGQRDYLRKKLELTQEGPYALALINARLGNRDEALRWLEKLCEERSGFAALLKVDPELDGLIRASKLFWLG